MMMTMTMTQTLKMTRRLTTGCTKIRATFHHPNVQEMRPMRRFWVRNVCVNVLQMRTARVRRRSVCVTEPVVCPVSNLNVNVRTSRTPVWELFTSADDCSPTRRCIRVSRVTMWSGLRNGCARRMGPGRALYRLANRTYSAASLPQLTMPSLTPRPHRPHLILVQQSSISVNQAL
uniref:Uncharacterized protein n=1 Tax=Cacopsylla melanoneura TaxID=428564 RepID=A0A8D8LTQ4_9HEMI